MYIDMLLGSVPCCQPEIGPFSEAADAVPVASRSADSAASPPKRAAAECRPLLPTHAILLDFSMLLIAASLTPAAPRCRRRDARQTPGRHDEIQHRQRFAARSPAPLCAAHRSACISRRR